MQFNITCDPHFACILLLHYNSRLVQTLNVWIYDMNVVQFTPAWHDMVSGAAQEFQKWYGTRSWVLAWVINNRKHVIKNCSLLKTIKCLLLLWFSKHPHALTINEMNSLLLLCQYIISLSGYELMIITPHACASGKVIGSVVVVVMDTKFAKSGDLDTWASCKLNEFVQFGEKLQYA